MVIYDLIEFMLSCILWLIFSFILICAYLAGVAVGLILFPYKLIKREIMHKNI